MPSTSNWSKPRPWTSQPYYDKCGGFYGDSFDDCLKQVVIDDTVLLAPGGADTVMDEVDSSIHIIEEEVKKPNAGVVD